MLCLPPSKRSTGWMSDARPIRLGQTARSLRILQPPKGARQQHRHLDRFASGGPDLVQRQDAVVPTVALATQHDDIFRLLKSSTRVRLMVDVEVCGRWAERALMMRSLEG
jgi:hypothetical protein